ncbi:Toluene tolerance, Ttg2 [compost metagenome]
MFSVAFRLRLVNDAWRFYDIIAENISMVRNYREQFEGIVGNGGPEALLRSLEDSVKRPPAAK